MVSAGACICKQFCRAPALHLSKPSHASSCPHPCLAHPRPAGAKTLCNACGVKRTRKLRAEQEGAKRRKLSAAPLPQPSAKHHTTYTGSGKYPGRAAAAAAAAVIESYGSLEPELEAWGLPSAAAPPAGARARPPRRAAEEAAFRTARYARTGGSALGLQCACLLGAHMPLARSCAEHFLLRCLSNRPACKGPQQPAL